MSRREQTAFDRYLERSEPYFDAVRAAGDKPWFEDPEKRAPALAALGLPVDTPPIELRRAMYERGHRKENQP